MRELIQRRPFLVFYVIAVGLASVVWTYITLLEIALSDSRPGGFSIIAHYYETQARIIAESPILHHHRDSVLLFVAGYIAVPVAFAAFFFPFAPTVAALVVTAVGWGRRALLVLLSLYVPVRGAIGLREALRIYAMLIAAIVAAVVGILLYLQLFDDPARVPVVLNHLGVIDWRYLLSAWVVAALFTQGALLEELGWRGFALPLLVRRFGSPLIGALLVGVAWTFWHLPREVPLLLGGAQTFGAMYVQQFWFLLACCSASIVITYFVNITGGSVLPAIILHGMFNFITPSLWLDAATGDRVRGAAFEIESVMVWMIPALLVLALVGRDLGWRRRLAVHGGDGSTDPTLVWSAARGGAYRDAREATTAR